MTDTQAIEINADEINVIFVPKRLIVSYQQTIRVGCCYDKRFCSIQLQFECQYFSLLQSSSIYTKSDSIEVRTLFYHRKIVP